MTIRIGQRPSTAATPTAGTSSAQRSFEAPKVGGAATIERGGAGLHARLGSGDIDAREYAEGKVREATDHLEALPFNEREEIRRVLLERLESDPALARLFQIATGHAASGLQGE